MNQIIRTEAQTLEQYAYPSQARFQNGAIVNAETNAKAITFFSQLGGLIGVAIVAVIAKSVIFPAPAPEPKPIPQQPVIINNVVPQTTSNSSCTGLINISCGN